MMLAGHPGAEIASVRSVIARLVRNMERSGVVSRSPVEKATGRRLHVVGEDEYFRSYVAEPVREGKLSYAIDLREPKPGSGATGGAMLVIQVSGGCKSREALQARYRGLRLTYIPRGRSPEEQAYWTRAGAVGRIVVRLHGCGARLSAVGRL